MRRCSVLRERRERLGREHAGHSPDLRHDGLEEVLAGVRADAGHDIRISGRADEPQARGTAFPEHHRDVEEPAVRLLLVPCTSSRAAGRPG